MAVSAPPAALRIRSLGDRFVSPVLVGRENEMSDLLAALADPPRLILIAGDAGMGKTRLCQALFENPALRGHRVLQGQCHQLREPFPFGPIVEALRGAARFVHKSKLGPVAGALVPLIPELADRLPPPLDPLGDPPSERHRLFRGLADVLASLGTATLVIDDLHWADDGTCEFLTVLSGQMPPQLTVLATVREEEMPHDRTVRRFMEQRTFSPVVELGPLSKEDVRAVVAAILETDISHQFAHFLHERSGGIPFAVEELLRLLQDREDLVQQSGQWLRRELESIELPAGLTAPVLERVARLSPAAQLIVEAAAIAGQPVTKSFLLNILLGEASSRDVTEALESKVLLEREGLIGFRHALARHAVEEAIPASRRRSLHDGAGRELERSEPHASARLARHFREAEDWREFAKYAEAAADLGMERGDDASAAHFLTEAVRARGISPEDRVRISLKLGKAALHGLAHDEAIAVIEAIVDDASIPSSARGELRMSLAGLQVQAGDVRGFDQVPMAIEELREDPGRQIDAVRAMAWPLSPRGTLREHSSWIARAAGLARSLQDPLVNMAVRNDEAFLLLFAGDPAGRRAISAIPVDLSSREAQREYIRGRENFASALATLGHYEQALRHVREGIQVSRSSEYERWIPFLEMTEQMVRFAIGSWDGLQARAEAMIEQSAELPRLNVHGKLLLGQLLLARDELPRAEQLLEDVVGQSQEIAEFPACASASGALARLELSRDDPERACATARAVFTTVRRKGLWAWAAPVLEVAVDALFQVERRDEAELLLAEFHEGTHGRDAPLAEAALKGARGIVSEELGDVVGALRHYRDAVHAYASLPHPVKASSHRARIGRLLMSVDPLKGRAMLERAVRDLDRLGATWEAGEARKVLRQLGVTLPYRGGRRGYGSRLSPREIEVARLAMSYTNNEVAKHLFLSVKTVEKHLSSAMRKVQATCRTELARHLEPVDG